MAAISASNIRKCVWTNFKTFFDNCTYTTTPTITTSFNDKDNNYPMIILHQSKIPKDKCTLNGTILDHPNCTQVFEVHTKSNTQLQDFLDETDAGLTASASSLESDGMQFKQEGYWGQSDDGQYMLNNQKIHMTVITLNFEITKTV